MHACEYSAANGHANLVALRRPSAVARLGIRSASDDMRWTLTLAFGIASTQILHCSLRPADRTATFLQANMILVVPAPRDGLTR